MPDFVVINGAVGQIIGKNLESLSELAFPVVAVLTLDDNTNGKQHGVIVGLTKDVEILRGFGITRKAKSVEDFLLGQGFGMTEALVLLGDEILHPVCFQVREQIDIDVVAIRDVNQSINPLNPMNVPIE